MADLVFNRAKGRGVEWAERINGNDPANSAAIASLWNITATDATQRDLDALTITYDDTNDRVDVDSADQTWTALGAGTAITDLIIGYDSDTTAGTDSGILPWTQHDFAATPDGSDITAQISVFYRAS
jgi:hypothetical protein